MQTSNKCYNCMEYKKYMRIHTVMQNLTDRHTGLLKFFFPLAFHLRSTFILRVVGHFILHCPSNQLNSAAVEVHTPGRREGLDDTLQLQERGVIKGIWRIRNVHKW